MWPELSLQRNKEAGKDELLGWLEMQKYSSLHREATTHTNNKTNEIFY